MKLAFLALTLILLFRGACFSQELRTDVMKPGRTMETSQPKSFADSAEFIKIFKELYPKIKPSLSVHETAEQHFKAISRTFKAQGIDSAEAAKAAFKNLDDSGFYKIYFETYRRNLSAKELKKYVEFINTPEGEHIIQVLPSLQRTLPDANTYVARTINVNLTPIRQAAREKAEKEQPPKKQIKPRPGQVNVFDGSNAGSKDSLIRMQHGQNKIPPVKIPADTSAR